MSPKKYEAFAKVAELKSLTRAAEELGYTQSGVSHMISALEEEFGFTLMRRSRAGVSLTEDGARVLPAIHSILSGYEQLRQVVAATHGLEAGTVRVGVFSSVAVHWLPGMLGTFQQKYPGITFKLLNGDYHDIELWLNSGAVDLGFITLPTAHGWHCIPLVEDRLLAILPPDHPLAQHERFPLAAAETEDFIGLLASSNHDVRRALEPAGIRPHVKFTTKDDYAVIAMVENGLGISIMPELLLRGHDQTVRCMELDPPAKRTIALAIPDLGSLSPAGRSFARHICRWVGAHGGPGCLVAPESGRGEEEAYTL